MKDKQSKSRRQFLKATGAVGALSAVVGCQSAEAQLDPAGAKGSKNLIFLVVDGMCNGTLGLAHHWSLHNRKRGLNWMDLYNHAGVNRCFQDTASANSPVTDSAAAASSWGCGQRVNNGSINTDPNGKELKPLMSYVKAAGKSTGLVTTCRVTHATPAGFSTNVPQRNMEEAIAKQYYEREIDVILGGGARSFVEKKKGESKTDYLPLFREKGYDVVQTKSELDAKQNGTGRLLGLFSDSHIPYKIDRENDASLSEVPDLPQMFRAALDRLSQNPKGFVLQVEAGRVDHAGHANDAGAILREFLEFDECIPVALEFIKANPDTMLIITTDHSTGGCQLNGQGKAYIDSKPALDRINQLKYSFEWLQNSYQKNSKFDAALFAKATGISATPEQAAIVQKALDNKERYLSIALNAAFGQQLEELSAVGWTSSTHNAECVDFFAFGAGSEKVPPFFKNYQLFDVMTKTLGLV